MSASLVGSEMCIRDRYRLIRSSYMHLSKWTGKYCENDPNRTVDVAIEPVSYTHLTLPTICSV
eukprot:6156469-Alexandrium_andersonii.AAC.1